MKRTFIFLAILACSLAASAEPLKGVVRNNTTNKPSVGDEITLKRIGNGMEDVGKTKTNSKGEFSFNVPRTPQPYIIWIEHQGVTYTQRAMPGGNAIEAHVFDAGPNVEGISIIQHAMLFHTGEKPETLIGEEIYTVGNSSSPPRTLMKDHTLEFYLPEGVNITESTVRTSGGTELRSAVIPAGEKDKYAFKFPVRPGETLFHVVYSLPYTGTLKIDPKREGPVGSLVVATPDPMKFSPSDKALYQPDHNAQFRGVNFFVAKNVTPQQQAGFEISGAGDMPQDSAPAAGTDNGGAQGRPEGRPGPGGGLGVPNEMPDPLHSGQWLFLGVLSLFLAAGAVFVFTSNQKLAPAAAQPQDRASMLMEAMKEEVFQLESDRLQNKISPHDYQIAKAALDKTLQRAVQRQSGKGK